MPSSEAYLTAPAKSQLGTLRTFARTETGIGLVLVAPALLLLLFAFLVPLYAVVRNSLIGPDGLTIVHFQRFLGDPFYLRILGRTFFLGLLGTVLTLLPGYILAHNIAFHPNMRWRTFVLVVTLVPLVVNLIVRIFGWMGILAPGGLAFSLLSLLALSDRPVRLLFSETAIVIGFVHSHFTFMALSILSSLTKINPNLLRAASNLGAGPWRSFYRVILPLSMPGIVGGSLLCFALNVSDFAAPALLGGERNRLMSYLIYEQQLFLANERFAAAQTVILIVCSAAALGGAMALSARRGRSLAQ
jgi:putative spermidine/putrescine transport system permease protein